MTFLNWLCRVEWESDFKIAKKHGVEMYILYYNKLRRTGNIKANIDRLRNQELSNNK